MKILTDIYHPAITQYFSSFKEDGYFFVVMEYCNVTFNIYIFKDEFFVYILIKTGWKFVGLFGKPKANRSAYSYRNSNQMG